MNPRDAIRLIQYNRIPQQKPTHWLELGAGQGLFTLALASLLAPGSGIHAVDKSYSPGFVFPPHPSVRIQTISADFLRDELPPFRWDGLLMANSLHYVPDKAAFLHNIVQRLQSDAILLIVEYDTDKANAWVPFPIRCVTLQELFMQHFGHPGYKLRQMPSRYNRGNIYSLCLDLGLAGAD